MTFRRIERKGKGGRVWHSYDLDGRRVPGVTTLIGNAIPKPALIAWAARCAGECAADNIDTISRMDRNSAVDFVRTESDRRKNMAGVKGTAIHGIAQRIAAGESVEVPEAIAGYVDAYLAWTDEWRPELIAVEAAVLSRRWFYGGTFDLLAALPGELCSLVDIKTGGSGVWPETCLQIAAYRHAEVMLVDGQEVALPPTNAGHALWLADDGTYEFMPVESGPDIFAVFLHACHVAGFMDRKRDDLIGNPLAAPEAVA